MNPKPLSIRSRAIVPVGIPVSSDERTPGIIPEVYKPSAEGHQACVLAATHA